MPSTVIHEEVGYYISKKLNINSYDYFLGILAPDSPNLEGFAKKEERWTAHQRDKDYYTWRRNINEMYKEEINNYPKDFIIGYYIHILTDIIYDEFIYLDVKKKIIEDNNLEEKSHDIMREDMDRFSFKEINDIIKILESNKTSYDILNINKNLLNNFKNEKIKNISKENKSIYITDEIINKLNKYVYEEIIREKIIG